MIPITKTFKEIEFLGGQKSIATVLETKPKSIFDEKLISFLHHLSRSLANIPEAREFPDIATFAFFCRKANLNQQGKKYSILKEIRFGWGTSLHFAPSNVPLNFAYSMVVGLITGNSCLVRLSDKEFPQSLIVLRSINRLLNDEKYNEVKERICLFRYNKDKDITNYLSSKAAIRIIWGGDETINEIRKSPLPPSGFDVTFSDKYSGCIIDSKKYLDKKNFKKEAVRFFNDTLTFDQNACTSPRFIYWFGQKSDIKKARDIFWSEFDSYAKNKNFSSEGKLATDKLFAQQVAAINFNAKNNKAVSSIKRSWVDNIPEDFEKFFLPGGFFLEIGRPDIHDFGNLITSKMQTLTYIGCSGEILLRELKIGNNLGIDRVVPNGTASDFSFIWDGMDLIRLLSKQISLF